MKHKELFQCNNCDELTRLDIKTKRLVNGIRHSYAQCSNCGYKSTVYYTNKRIRKLMSKQLAEVNQDKKNALSVVIKREMDELRERRAIE